MARDNLKHLETAVEILARLQDNPEVKGSGLVRSELESLELKFHRELHAVKKKYSRKPKGKSANLQQGD